MKKLISAAAGLVLAFTLAVSAFAQSEASFSDVLPGSWYYKEVTEMVSSGFIDGYGDGSFRPEQTVTVAECVTMAARITGAATGEADGFWGGVQMSNAYLSGWMSEDDVERSRPDTPVTRELASKIIATALGLSYPAGTELPFTDAAEIGQGYLSGVMAMYANGLLDGYEDGTLRPQSTLTRAQAASMLYRAVHTGEDSAENYITAEGYTAQEIIDYFCEVALDVEYGSTDNTVIKWDRPINIFVSGAPTAADLERLGALIDALNGIAGFPGINSVDSAEAANLRISFVDAGTMLANTGSDFNGYVRVSWNDHNIYSGDIYYRSDLTQERRNGVIVEELCQALGLLTDT